MDHGDVDARQPLLPEKSPGPHFRRLGGTQDQSGYEGVKKNLHSSDIRYRTRAL